MEGHDVVLESLLVGKRFDIGDCWRAREGEIKSFDAGDCWRARDGENCIDWEESESVPLEEPAVSSGYKIK